MGLSLSQEKIDELIHKLFTSLPKEYINVGIDDTMLNYTGIGSNAVLNSYYSKILSELQDKAPSYIEKAGDSLADFKSVPQAVGLGALVIPIVLEIAFIAIKGSQSKQENPAGMLRRIFAEEKASEVRDLMEEYLKRYKMHLTAEHLLLEDTRQLERSLSLQLTRLRNSMLADGQMNSRSLKHWANGAAFHAQMLIHLTRLQKKDAERFEIAKSAARSAIETYGHDTSKLLKKYKEYKTSNFAIHTQLCFYMQFTYCPTKYILNDVDLKYQNSPSFLFTLKMKDEHYEYTVNPNSTISLKTGMYKLQRF